MSTHGSRKRRHKSREKMQTASTNSDDNQDSNQPQPQEQPKDEQGEAGGRQELVAILDRLFSKSMEDGAPAADSNDRLSRVACLSVAASIGHVEGVKKLLDENLDVNARSKGCFTVLQSAVSWKHYKIAEMLLQKGAEVSDPSETGQNSLMLAAANGDVTMMNLLWNYKGSDLDINAIDQDGNTALHLSAQSSNKEAVSFLLHRGALGDVKNNLGQTVLHKAAKLGDLETCELFIQHFSSGDTSGCEQVAKLILSEDTEGRTPICEALKNQHLLLVQLLLNACRPEDALEFYMRRIHKLGSLSSDDPSFDMQSILGSLLLVVKSLQKEFLSQLATADPIHHLVQTIRLHVTSPRVLSAACLMISQLIWKEDPGTDEAISQQEETLDLRDDLLQRFLHCKGPDVVMEKLSTHVLTAHDTYIVVSTLLPIMILASRSAGRTWLGQNSGNLSFYKELLTRNKTFITHINISNHMGQGLQVSQVIKTFLGFVESIEAKDREQNLAELLEEEERDRIKREKKKRKRQKRHKQSKLDVTQTSTAEGSTDDENGEQGAWNAEGLCNADLFSPGEAGPDKDHALYYQQKVNDQTEQKANDASQEKFGLQAQVLREKECTRKAFPLEACVPDVKVPGVDSKWHQDVSTQEEFPPISTGYEDRVNADPNDGWVKVENRKVGSRSANKPVTTGNLSATKVQDFPRPGPMRWADVAKIGCSRDGGARNFTVLVGDVNRTASSDFYKLTSGSRGTENPTPHAAHGEGVKVRADDDSEDWQQVARNAFVDNMSVKVSQKDRSPCTPVSSDCDTDELSSTGSSECPSAASNGLLNSKDPLSIVDDFTLADPTHMSMHKMFPSSFSHFFDESKDKNLFSMDDLGEPKRSSHDIIHKLAAIKDINHHSNDGKHTSSWSWLKDKPLAEYPTSWDITPRSRPLLQTTSGKVQVQSEGEDMEEGNDAQLDDHPRVKLSSKTDFFDDFLPDLDSARFSSMTDDSFFHRFDKSKAGKSTPVFGMLSKKDLYDQDLFELSLLAGDKEAWAGERNEWGKKEFRMKPESRGFENSWFDRRSDEGATKIGHSDNPGCYMPSFASMAGVLDNNPIVTSVVESVLTAPTVTSLPGLGLPDKQQPTYSNKASVVPSPPPGFNFQKPNPMRALAFDPTLVLYNSQTLLSGKTSNTQDAKNLSSDAQMDFESNRSTDKLIFGATKPRTPMVGVVGPFSNTTTDLSNSDQFHTQRFQNSTLPVFSHAGDFSTGMPSLPVRPTSTHTVFGLPVSSTPIFSGSNAGSNCWQDRTSNVCTVTASNMTSSSSLCATLGDLTARLQPRVSYRVSDQQLTLSKRPQDISFRTFQDAVESYQRRQNEQFFLHQQHQQQLMLDRQQQTAQQLLKQYKTAAAGWQKPHLNLLQQRQHQLRQFQPRQLSPPVLFPGSLRDEPEPRDGLTLPAFQDNTPTDLLSDLFADPLLVEKIAINQIRQQFWSAQVNNLAKDSISPFRDSVYSNDLEYYASLYRVKIRDVLVGPIQTESSSQAEQTPRVETDRLTLTRGSRAQDGRPGSPEREMVTTERCSRRWRDAINRILDTPWTTRRQYGDIVLPSSLSEYNISHVEYPLVLGLTTDGNEVVVLILDKSQAYIDPCLLDVMCDPEFDHHFILKCKAISETHSSMYVALELCDYTLAEYVHIVQLSHRQDPLSANRLAWQLLEGLKFVHHHLGMPHGNLKPSWIFVDVEGRLRLGGYGIVTRTPEPTTADRNEMVRSACWTSSEDLNTSQPQSSKASDIQVAGMLLYFILTGGQHPFGTTPLEAELNIARSSSQMQHISEEANDLVSGMLFPDPAARPTVEHCLKHPFFWSSEKKFRLILIVGSDVLTEMKTGIALTGNGSPTMMEILSVLDITEVSPNWVQAINPTVMKEMRSFRVYKNCLSELTLFIYNCCLHFDKMSALAKEVLDDPCKYFQGLFPSLFMAIYRSLKASDRIDRTCYKPFF